MSLGETIHERADGLSSDDLSHVALPIALEVSSAPDHSAYRVRIHLAAIGLTVEAIEADVGKALRAAADRCAERLGRCGYPISSASVLAALEDRCDDLEPIDAPAVPALN